MKKLFTILLVGLGVILSSQVTQAANEIQAKGMTFLIGTDKVGTLTGTRGTKYAILTKINQKKDKIQIPYYVSTKDSPSYKVLVIAENVCEGLEGSIDTLVIPGYVRSISPKAFENKYIACLVMRPEHEELLRYPENGAEIGNFIYGELASADDSPFRNTMVSTLLIKANDYGKYYIPSYLFAGNTTLFSVKVEMRYLQSIGKCAFQNCTTLATLTMPTQENELRFIGEKAFESCTNLISPLILPLSLRFDSSAETDIAQIGERAFAQTKIPSLTISTETSWRKYEIQNGAFKDCSEMTYVFLGGEAIRLANVFNGCTGVQTLVFAPKKDWRIVEKSPFDEFTNLKRLEYGSSDQYYSEEEKGIRPVLHADTYTGSTLKEIWIKQSVKDVDPEAFPNSLSIKTVLWDVEGDLCRDYTSCPFGMNVDNIAFGFHVKEIPGRLFANTKITYAVLPSSVEVIREGAFAGSKLEALVLPQYLKSIGKNAFKYNRLTSVTIPAFVKEIGSDAFIIETLKSVQWNAYRCKYVPNETAITQRVFEDGSLMQITFGYMVEDIPAYLCAYQNQLTSVMLPGYVKTIGTDAFYACTGLGKIYSNALYAPGLTNSTVFGNVASGCTAYVPAASVTDYKNAEGWKELPIKPCGNDPQGTFGTNHNMKWRLYLNYQDGKNVLAVSGDDEWNYDFDKAPWRAYTELINAIIIDDDVESVPDNAFYGCYAATELVVGKNVKSIYHTAFEECTALQVIYWNAEEYPAQIRENYWPFMVDEQGEFASQIKEFHIGNQVKTIPSGLCYNMKSLASIDIPNSVTEIGMAAFTGCTGLEQINVAEENPNFSMEDGVLMSKDKTKLILYPNAKETTSYVVPETVTSFGDAAFAFSPYLETVIVPEGVEALPPMLFAECPRLYGVNLPSTLKELQGGVFAGSDRLFMVFCYAEVPPTMVEETYYGYNLNCAMLKEASLLVPGKAVEAYRNTVAEKDYIQTWKDFGFIMPIPGTGVESDIEDDVKPEGLEEISCQMSEFRCQKVLRDGQLLILHGNRTYTAQGILVKK